MTQGSGFTNQTDSGDAVPLGLAPRAVRYRPKQQGNLLVILGVAAIPVASLGVGAFLLPLKGDGAGIGLLRGIGGLLIVGFVLFCVWTLRTLFADRKLVESGTPTWATVTSREIRPAGRVDVYFLHLTYPTTTGDKTGMVGVERAYYDAREIGDRLLVLYDPQNPARHILYDQADWVAV